MNHYKEETVSESSVRRRTLISLCCLVLFFCAVIFIWKKLQNETKDEGALKTLRKGLDANEWFFSTFLFSTKHLTKEYSKKLAAPKVRVNGDAGLTGNTDTSVWRLQLVRKPGDTLRIPLSELMSLPKTEVVFNFKCIEGWNQVSHWGGVRFSDFVEKYHLEPQSEMRYVSMVTPDKEYYVGVDMRSMMQPQTILCYEMNGAPLPMKQGYPLRLIIPVKYGVKHLKQIGTLSFANERPKDYWYERGYDYYCGL